VDRCQAKLIFCNVLQILVTAHQILLITELKKSVTHSQKSSERKKKTQRFKLISWISFVLAGKQQVIHIKHLENLCYFKVNLTSRESQTLKRQTSRN